MQRSQWRRLPSAEYIKIAATPMLGPTHACMHTTAITLLRHALPPLQPPPPQPPLPAAQNRYPKPPQAHITDAAAAAGSAYMPGARLPSRPSLACARMNDMHTRAWGQRRGMRYRGLRPLCVQMICWLNMLGLGLPMPRRDAVHRRCSTACRPCQPWGHTDSNNVGSVDTAPVEFLFY